MRDVTDNVTVDLPGMEQRRGAVVRVRRTL